MVKRFLIALLAGLLLLSAAACKSQELPQETETVPTQEPTETQPITVSGDVLQLQWESGNKILLLQEQGVTIYLTKDADFSNVIHYDFEIKNDSDKSVLSYANNFLFNNRFMVDSIIFSADPGEWGESSVMFPIAAEVGELGKIEYLSFDLCLYDDTTYEPISEQAIQVNVSGSSSLKPIYAYADQLNIGEPYMGFYVSQEQVLLEEDGLRISMLAAGKVPDQDYTVYNDLVYIYRIENTSNEWRHFFHCGTSVNDVYFSNDTTTVNLQPNAVFHGACSFSDLFGMEAISSMKLYLDVGTGKATEASPTNPQWYTVTPKEAAPSVALEEGEILLLEEQGLRVTLQKAEDDYYTGKPVWSMVVVNNTDRDLFLGVYDAAVGDQQSTGTEYSGVYLENSHLPANQRTVMRISGKEDLPISFRLYAKDMFGGQDFLFVTEGRIELIPI